MSKQVDATDSGAPRSSSARIIEVSAEHFIGTLPLLLAIYATAMAYQPTMASERIAVWRSHTTRAGFRCVVAIDNDEIIGFSYGYLGRSGQWWHGEVARGLRNPQHRSLHDYFELTELHVLPQAQARGVGEALLRALVAPVAAQQVLLSTPEGPTRAWRLYRRLGFTDVLRHFLFIGDDRPFAVLARRLPLESSADPEQNDAAGDATGYVIP